MKIFHDYIKSILAGEIIINCASKNKEKFLKEIGAKNGIFGGQIWCLKYQEKDELELATKLEKLRDVGFCFAGSAVGWPPAAIFAYLREKGYISGKIIEIMWSAPNKEIKRER